MMKGYETFFETIKSELKDPLDLIVSTIHWILVQELDFKCVGISEEFKPEDENKTGSELLPPGWNSISNLYILLYRSSTTSKAIILLKCVVVGNGLQVTISGFNQPDSSNYVHSINILKTEFLDLNSGSENSQIYENFKKEKVDRLAEFLRQNLFSKFKTQSSSKSKMSNDKDSQHTTPFSKFIPAPAQSRLPLDDDSNRLIYPPIGGSDIDPLGRGLGGGMIFDPFAGNRFRPERGPDINSPRGYLPPGARYDPFGPLPDARFFRPDPDHMQPPRGPGFDNFFM